MQENEDYIFTFSNASSERGKSLGYSGETKFELFCVSSDSCSENRTRPLLQSNNRSGVMAMGAPSTALAPPSEHTNNIHVNILHINFLARSSDKYKMCISCLTVCSNHRLLCFISSSHMKIGTNQSVEVFAVHSFVDAIK